MHTVILTLSPAQADYLTRTLLDEEERADHEPNYDEEDRKALRALFHQLGLSQSLSDR